MIQAAIFDMDGLLIDSEPLWHEAEIAAFKTCGITLTKEMCLETTGLRVDEVVHHWHHKFPWDSPSQKEVEDTIWKAIIAEVEKNGVAKNGVIHALDFMKKKEVKIALASSSSMKLIDVVVDKMNIRSYFDFIYSAEHEEYGKPHPGVYLTTAHKLSVNPVQCVALEDSFNGMVSAKAAKMKLIAVPDAGMVGSKKLGVADVVLNSLEEINETVWEELNK